MNYHQYNKEWFDLVHNSGKKIFNRAKDNIPNNILSIAAEYTYKAKCQFVDGEKSKLKSLDPIHAAYCIESNGYLITENQHDFPDPFFTVIALKPIVTIGKEGRKHRRILAMLKSNGLEKQ